MIDYYLLAIPNRRFSDATMNMIIFALWWFYRIDRNYFLWSWHYINMLLSLWGRPLMSHWPSISFKFACRLLQVIVVVQCEIVCSSCCCVNVMDCWENCNRVNYRTNIQNALQVASQNNKLKFLSKLKNKIDHCSFCVHNLCRVQHLGSSLIE